MAKSYRQLFLESQLKNQPAFNDMGQRYDPTMPERGWQDSTTQAGVDRSNEIMSQIPPLNVKNDFRGPVMSVNPQLSQRGGYQQASVDQNVITLIQKYFPQDQWATAYAVMMAESGGKNIPSQYNQYGREDSHGYFQINLKAHPQMAGKVYDPEENVKFASELWKKQGWRPWGAFTNGSYKQYLNDASQTFDTSQPPQSPLNRFMDAIGPQTVFAAEKETTPTTLPKGSEVMSQKPYTVKKGDTLWDIADKYLGSGTRWKDLIGYTGDPRKMPIGTQITIPTTQTQPSAPARSPLPPQYLPSTTPPTSAISKYFEPGAVGGFKINEPTPTPAPKIPVPTSTYIAKQANPILRYFQPNTMGGYQV